jgi:hypothetical protein
MKSLSVGSVVSFIDDVEYKKWNVTSKRGIVLDVRSYGPIESMVTAKFGDCRIYVADRMLQTHIV